MSLGPRIQVGKKLVRTSGEPKWMKHGKEHWNYAPNNAENSEEWQEKRWTEGSKKASKWHGDILGISNPFVRAFLVTHMVKNPSTVWETRVWSLGWEDPRRKAWQPTQYSCLEHPHKQRRMACCSPWGRKELDTTEQLSTVRDLYLKQSTTGRKAQIKSSKHQQNTWSKSNDAVMKINSKEFYGWQVQGDSLYFCVCLKFFIKSILWPRWAYPWSAWLV